MFLKFGNLSFINQFSKYWHRLASIAPDRKFNMNFHNSVKKSKWNYFSPYIIEFKNKDGFKIFYSDFSGFKTLWSLIDLCGLCNLTGLKSLYSHISSKNFLILMVWSSITPKWPIEVVFCGMDHQKSKFSLMYGTISIRGFWGQSVLVFWKLVDETQMSKALDATRHHNLTKLLISIILKKIKTEGKQNRRK